MAVSVKDSPPTDSGPPILLIHGAWHGAWCWSPLAERLLARNIVVHAIDLPGHGELRRWAWRISLRTYVAAVRRAIEAAAEPVILVGHSMGGGVITAVAEGMSDKIAALVYVAAFVPRDGDSIVALTHMTAPMAGLQARLAHGDIGMSADNASRLFFHDVPDAAQWAHRVQPQPIRPVREAIAVSSATLSAMDAYYVACRADRAIPHDFQLRMAAHRPMARIFEMGCGHSPFLASPDELAAILAEIRAGYVRVWKRT